MFSIYRGTKSPYFHSSLRNNLTTGSKISNTCLPVISTHVFHTKTKLKGRYILPFLVAVAATFCVSSHLVADSIPIPKVVFHSEKQLREALHPLTLEEVKQRIRSVPKHPQLELQYDENLEKIKCLPLRNMGFKTFLKTELCKTKTLTVYYPEDPRVPHHLAIALNRKNVRGISDVSLEENHELFAMIRKITEIYQQLDVSGFVIAQFDAPQPGHLDRYVIEIIPHTPGFNYIKNFPDKAACNQHVLFREENLSPVVYDKREDIHQHTRFWKKAFKQEHPSLSESETAVTFPYERQDAYKTEGGEIVRQHILEYLESKGGRVENYISQKLVIPTDVPDEVYPVVIDKCVFCDEAIVNRQLVYEYGTARILYNIRKGSKPGLNFLIIPKRHAEKVYNLKFREIDDISTLRKALVEVLQEKHPYFQIVDYIQDHPSVGQTVFHSHEQLVAIDPKTIALTWSFDCLYPNSHVSDEEMSQVCQEIGDQLHQKLSVAATLKCPLVSENGNCS